MKFLVPPTVLLATGAIVCAVVVDRTPEGTSGLLPSSSSSPPSPSRHPGRTTISDLVAFWVNWRNPERTTVDPTPPFVDALEQQESANTEPSRTAARSPRRSGGSGRRLSSPEIRVAVEPEPENIEEIQSVPTTHSNLHHRHHSQHPRHPHPHSHHRHHSRPPTTDIPQTLDMTSTATHENVMDTTSVAGWMEKAAHAAVCVPLAPLALGYGIVSAPVVSVFKFFYAKRMENLSTSRSLINAAHSGLVHPFYAMYWVCAYSDPVRSLKHVTKCCAVLPFSLCTTTLIRVPREVTESYAQLRASGRGRWGSLCGALFSGATTLLFGQLATPVLVFVVPDYLLNMAIDDVRQLIGLEPLPRSQEDGSNGSGNGAGGASGGNQPQPEPPTNT